MVNINHLFLKHIVYIIYMQHPRIWVCLKMGVYPKKVNLQQELNDDEPVDSADTILRTEHDIICHTQLVYIDLIISHSLDLGHIYKIIQTNRWLVVQ